MELNDTTFLLVIVGYVVGGLICVALGATGLGGRSLGGRLFAVVAGIAFVGYAGYLLFTPTDTVWVFWYPMLLPFLLAFKAVQGLLGSRRQTA